MRELREYSIEEVAHRLRLRQGMIELLESKSFPGELPEIFARGHLKSYARLLQFSEQDIQSMLASFDYPPNTAGISSLSAITGIGLSKQMTYLLTGVGVLIMIAILTVWLGPTLLEVLPRWLS